MKVSNDEQNEATQYLSWIVVKTDQNEAHVACNVIKNWICAEESAPRADASDNPKPKLDDQSGSFISFHNNFLLHKLLNLFLKSHIFSWVGIS